MLAGIAFPVMISLPTLPAESTELRQQGWEHIRAGNAADAEAAFQRALELDAATCFQGTGDVIEACRGVIESAAAGPEMRREAHHWLGEHLQFTEGRLKDAIVEYDNALELDPDHIPSLLGRADALIAVNDGTAALGNLDHAIGLGADWSAYLLRARIHDALGNKEKAVADFTSVLERNPGHHGAREALAELRPLP